MGTKRAWIGVIALMLAACAEPPPPPPPPNQPPVAIAGPDQVLYVSYGLATGPAELEGLASKDPDGSLTRLLWTEHGNTIATGYMARVMFTVGVHMVTLTVTDNDGASAADDLVVTIKEEAPPPTPPTPSSSCHPSYSGCLLRNAGDYDCRSGKGNGPNYTGRVQVVGPDVFGLDDDNDGIGCDRG
jgi:hypothetical protein